MIEATTAKKLLSESVLDFIKHNNDVLTASDLEAEVINHICLYIMGHQKREMQKESSIENMFVGFLKNYKENKPVDIAKVFTTAAMELFPDYYSPQMAVNAIVGVHDNIAWDGMWDFLKNYFWKNHEMDIEKLYS